MTAWVGAQRQVGLAAGKDPGDFLVHDQDPPNAELRRGRAPGSPLTPYAAFFVRNKVAARGHVDRGQALAVDGVVHPRPLLLSDLAALPQATAVAALQCAGNGRAYFDHAPEGVPWRSGAVALGAWRGPLMRDVAGLLGGPVAGARYLTATGSEPSSERDRVERSVPLDKALADCLLALDLNGAPLPAAHGGPFRLVVPGWFAVNWVKYPRLLAFTADQSDAEIMSTDYRIAPVGRPYSPDQPTCWAMPVTSWITSPSDEAPTAGPVQVAGVALGGEHRVQRVEVTADAGATWADAELLDADLPPTAWRRFALTMPLATGTWLLASRATDAAGRIQPQHTTPNAGGYAANGWRGPAVALRIL